MSAERVSAVFARASADQHPGRRTQSTQVVQFVQVTPLVLHTVDDDTGEPST